ncbi:hypothetical protein ACOZ38_29005 [Sphaerisporangium viridialbum]|uniref:hypothetical protein n=1 Tax=Sphaerisporangium viridialbum TaxID=46189 RepID=UPI003C77BEB9
MRRGTRCGLRRIAAVAAGMALWLAGTGGLSAWPAFALGPGQVCVFIQPHGAPLPLGGTAGHIGWGYLVGGTSTWVYGSTENPDGATQIDAPGFNGAWSANESFARMLDDFRRQPHFPSTVKQPRPAHPYTGYKCRPTDTSAVGAANIAASDNIAAGYTFVGNNCLDAAYRVLRAYGAPDLPSPSLHWYPNDWYTALGGLWHAASLL